jgi:hypothetical protein
MDTPSQATPEIVILGAVYEQLAARGAGIARARDVTAELWDHRQSL